MKAYTLLSGLAMMVSTLQALGDFTVKNTADAGKGSFRQAILDADASGGGTISFKQVSGTIYLESSLPAFTAAITVAGPGADQLTVQGNGFSVFTNSAGNTVTLGGLSVTAGGGLLGSAIMNDGTLTVNHCILFGGHSVNTGAALHNTGSVSMSNCTVSGCWGGEAGGALCNLGTMTLVSCLLTNNRVGGAGGCIYNTGNLTADNCTFVANGYFNGGSGGAICNATGTVIVLNCFITKNYGISGGGIWNGGNLSVTNSTIAQNRATYSSGPTPGGGLYNHGIATLVNTTVSGNTAMDLGGGIWSDGTLWLENCTICSNLVRVTPFMEAHSGGGICNSGVVHSVNTIFAGNAAPAGPDFFGTLTSQGFNLLENISDTIIAGDTTGNLLGADPKLGPLQNNGGPTCIHALLPGSPAIDAGTGAGTPATDQRGVARPQGPANDIGAFEFQYSVPQFTRAAMSSTTNFWAQTCGLPNTGYTLEASTNLLDWVSVTNYTAGPNGVWNYVENCNSTFPRRFFRLKIAGP